MKLNTSIRFIWILMIAFYGFKSEAQRKQDERRILSINAGLSVFPADARSRISKHDSVIHFSQWQIPVLLANFDFTDAKRLSLGASAGFQTMGGHLNYFSDSTSSFHSIRYNVNKIALNARLQYQFVNTNRFQLYSGVKIGFQSIFTIDDSRELNYKGVSQLEKSRTTFGLIPLGMRLLITKSFGLNAETSLGVPTYCSAGISYVLP